MVIGTCYPKKTRVLLETTPAAPHKYDKAHGSKAFTLPPKDCSGRNVLARAASRRRRTAYTPHMFPRAVVGVGLSSAASHHHLCSSPASRGTAPLPAFHCRARRAPCQAPISDAGTFASDNANVPRTPVDIQRAYEDRLAAQPVKKEGLEV